MISGKVRLSAGLISVIGLMALAAQLPITIAGFVAAGGNALGGVGRFFGYFTIITNLVCAVIMGLTAVGALKRPKLLSAVTVYMTLLCLIYWLLLSKNNVQTGWNLVVDSTLHYAVPILTLTAWIGLFPKTSLTWSDPITWLAYPIGYSVYSLVRGAFEGWYPYFFLDVGNLGYSRVLVNIMGLGALFLVAGLILVSVSRTSKVAT
jgi:hypothetical protein